MRILAIDFGAKRIGLAVSDETQTFAREYNILSPQEFWKNINQIIETELIERIIVGLPKNMSGEDTAQTKTVDKFILELKKNIIVPVVTVDERLSSLMAETISGQKHGIDSLAAQIFLQNYLDQKK